MRQLITYSRRIALFALILLTLGVFARNTETVHAASSSKDVLRVGMEANYPPYNWTQQNDANGAVPIDGSDEFANGYDVQTAKIIGNKLGRKVVVVKTVWDGLLPSLTSGKIDLIIAGMSPTPERRKSIDFSLPYRRTKMIAVVNKDGKFADATSVNDFKNAKFTAQLATFHYDLINQLKGAIKEPAMKDFSAMRVALQAGTIDGYVAEDAEGISITKVNPNVKIVDLSGKGGFKVDPSEVQTAIGVKKGNPLLQQVNQIVADISPAQQEKMITKAVLDQPEAAAKGNWFLNIWKQYGGMLLRGTGMTLFISLIATIIGFVIGLLIGIARTIPRPTTRGKRWALNVLNWVLSVYIEIFRGTPMMVQAAVFYYGIAQIFGLNLERTFAAIVIVSINTGAYLAEVVRGGIISTPTGQFEAASALGMTHFQRMRKIILPQAIRNSLPSITNEFIVNIKDTSVLSIISVSELFFTGSTIAGQNFQFFQTYLTISLIYLVLTFTITRIFRVIEKRLEGPTNYNLMANQLQVTTPTLEDN